MAKEIIVETIIDGTIPEADFLCSDIFEMLFSWNLWK
jgi:hypothetical protein